MSRLGLLGALIFTLDVTSGCGSAEVALGANSQDDVGLSGAEQQLVGGLATNGVPEVGLLTFGNRACTATLISPRVALTAAHCVGYGTSTRDSWYGSVRFTNGGAVGTYIVLAYYAFSGAAGGNDVALLKLHANVPGNLAVPRDITNARPANDTGLIDVGYGCDNRATGGGAFTKRFIFGRWTGFGPYLGANASALCPGDSGGPLIASGGLIIGVNSGYFTTSGIDTFGYPWNVWNSLQFVRWIYQTS